MRPEKVPTICLSMIVKNEAHIITRCLQSVLPHIDAWAICDTGSTDGTQDVIRTVLAELPGELREDPWVDFGTNRTQALELAKSYGCDYTLVIDADEVLVVEDPEVLRTLTEDAYRVEMRFPTISYPRVNIMRAALDWRYVGVIHEYATCPSAPGEYLLRGVHMWTDGQGARGQSGDKAQRDLAVMQQSVIDEPHNARYWFYLAQGYEVAGDVDNAIATYAQRTTMGDYYEEVWYSHYRMAQLSALKQDWPAAILHYLNAYAADPTRAEPLYWLALGYHDRGQDRLALIFLEAAVMINQPVSALFLEPQVYQILRWVHYAVCLFNLGSLADAQDMAKKCLVSGKVPPVYLPILEKIITFGAPAAAPAPAAVE